MNYLRTNQTTAETSSQAAFNLADLVPWVHLQFANLLEKKRDETTLLKMHAQLAFKQKEKTILRTRVIVLFSRVAVLLQVWKAR